MPERTTIAQVLEAARGRIERLTPEAAQRALAGGALLVDTRAGDDRRQDGIIPGAVHVTLSCASLTARPHVRLCRPGTVGPSRQVILVCRHGYSSSVAAALLRELGSSAPVT